MDATAATARVPGRETSPLVFLLAALGASVLAHATVLLSLHGYREGEAKPQKTLEMVMVEVQKPPPPPDPPKEIEKPKPRPPIQVARPVVKPPEPPKEQAPPPPNDTPPPEPTKPVPLVVGISMSSTVAGGGFAAPVGNTLYGKTDLKAQNPQDVKPYSAPKYTPIYQVDSEPQVAHEVKAQYPDEAKRNGIEGAVNALLVVDDQGNVVNVKILNGPGYGLNEAAAEALRKFKFKPAMHNGEAVSTEIHYTYRWELD